MIELLFQKALTKTTLRSIDEEKELRLAISKTLSYHKVFIKWFQLLFYVFTKFDAYTSQWINTAVDFEKKQRLTEKTTEKYHYRKNQKTFDFLSQLVFLLKKDNQFEEMLNF